jgi:hypothetical protein
MGLAGHETSLAGDGIGLAGHETSLAGHEAGRQVRGARGARDLAGAVVPLGGQREAPVEFGYHGRLAGDAVGVPPGFVPVVVPPVSA